MGHDDDDDDDEEEEHGGSQATAEHSAVLRAAEASGTTRVWEGETQQRGGWMVSLRGLVYGVGMRSYADELRS